MLNALVSVAHTPCLRPQCAQLTGALVTWLHAMLQAVQQVMEDRVMSLREDMQASQQQVTGQFAQHQVWHHIMHAVLMRQ